MSASEKIAIVLLPGMDGTGELLKPLAKLLSAYRPVQIIGYPADQFRSYDRLASHVRERVPNDRFALLGESFSGPIAIEVAATDRRANGLILVSSFARHLLPSQLAAVARLFELKWLPANVVAAALMGSAATPTLKRQLRQALATLSPGVIQGRIRDVLRVDKRGRLAETQCPLLCLHGRSDRLVSKRHVSEIVAARPDGQVRWLDAPHMLLATHTHAAAEVIEGFCKYLNCR